MIGKCAALAVSAIGKGRLLAVFTAVLIIEVLQCTAQTAATSTSRSDRQVEVANDILARYPGQDDYVSPTRTVWVTEGDVAQLACNLTSPLTADPALLVLWYKDGISKPIYSYDMRNGAATHWRNPSHFGSRASFDTAFLKIQRIHKGDEGTYRCRVDFRTNPTLTFTTNLTVIVPPKRLAIYTDLGVMARSVVGPFTEGDVLRLSCRASGGSPTPRVTWWEGASLLDVTSEIKEVQEVTNLLVVPALTRNDLHRAFTCQSGNSNLTAPLLATVTLDMHFPPLWVRFLSNRDALSAGWPYSVVCQAAGARPSAVITWHLGSARVTTHTEKTSDDGNVTTSELRWTPTAADEGKILSCQAESPALSAQPLVDEWSLNIFYVPVTTLQPGRSVNLSNIEEGDDVYFECSIKANPPVYKIIWLHEGEELRHNVSAGVIISNQSLVLQKVAKTASGNYYCVASNIQGDGHSNPVKLKVQYAPICRNHHMVYHGAARYEQVNIPCDLDAYPTPMAFRWTFNNSGESVEIPQEHILVAGSRSTVSYTPNTELDYGTLLCWGINTVGQQHHPCVFHVFPAGHPDPVNNCSVYNLSVSVVHVRCVAGFDGGLPQTFILELYEQTQDRLLANASSPVPIFSVSGLPPGMTFTGVVYSYNSKGRGEKVSLHVYTIKDLAEKRTAAVKPSPPPEKQQEDQLLLLQPIIAVVLGVVGGLLVVLVVICAVVRLQYGRRGGRGKECGRAGVRDPVDGEEDPGSCHAKMTSASLKDMPPLPVSPDSESWVAGSVNTISSASLATTYTSLPRASHLCSSASYQPCSAEDTQYTELLLSGTATVGATIANTIANTPTPPSEPHDLTHVHGHHPPPHQYSASYPLPTSPTTTPTHAHTRHQCTPTGKRHPQGAGGVGQQVAPWTPSPVSIGRRHSLRRDPHPHDHEATVPLMTSQKESSV